MFRGRLIAAPRAAVRTVVAIALITTALVGGTATAATAATPATPATLSYAGLVQLKNAWKGGCLDEKTQDGPVNGGTVQTYGCINGDTAQQWGLYLLSTGDGHTYELINLWSGLCLDADTNTINHNGSKVQVYGCNGWTNQTWHIPLLNGTAVDVWNMWPGFTSPYPQFLDQDNRFGGGNGSIVQLYQYTGGINQEWMVQFVG